MSYALNPRLVAVAEPAVAEAQGWIAGRTFAADRPLIDMSQAVPRYPPPPALRAHLAQRMEDPLVHRYVPILGLPDLRQAYAAHLSAAYGGHVAPADVAITAGCNQAFCLATMALAEAGDEVLLPLPYYFNHQMWLDMLGVRAVHLPFRGDRAGVPDPADAAARIGPRTRAIVLVTPSNPTGAVVPPETIHAFHDLARAHGIALVLDETYKDFLPFDGPAHGLFARPDWAETVVQLYSFSKVFGISGHRVGALAAGPALLASLAKAMDCVAICAPRIGQEAALHGLRHAGDWVAGNRATMRARVAALNEVFRANAGGWEVVSVGAYFAYLRHPWPGRPAREVARALADEFAILCLPGSAFGPGQDDYLRFAFANVDAETMPEVARRLAGARLAP